MRRQNLATARLAVWVETHGFKPVERQGWRLRREFISPRYTTSSQDPQRRSRRRPNLRLRLPRRARAFRCPLRRPRLSLGGVVILEAPKKGSHGMHLGLHGHYRWPDHSSSYGYSC
jgi:hypothetical protein